MGIYDLALPSEGTAYEIRLNDTASTDGNDILVLEVIWNNGNGGIRFRHNDALAKTSVIVDQVLSLELNHNQIALKLRKNSADLNTITASYAYIDDGSFGSFHDFGNTVNIFNGEGFTRAEFGARESVVPEPATMLLLGLGLVGLAGVRRKFQN